MQITIKNGKFEPYPITLDGLTTKDGKVWREGNTVSNFEVFCLSEEFGPLDSWINKLPKEPEHAPRIHWVVCTERWCGWSGEITNTLQAPNPFEINKTLYACPRCKKMSISGGCNVDGCNDRTWVGKKCFGHYGDIK